MENITSSETSELRELTIKYSPFLREMRRRILITASFFLVASVFGFLFYERIIKFIISLLSLQGVNIVFTSPFQFINLAISCGIATGITLVFPIILYQILSFLKPALKHKEFNMVVRFLPFSIFLFLLGFSFGIFIMKWQIQLFLTKSQELGIGNILDISALISTVILVSSFIGIASQFPIVLLLLLRLEIVSYSTLSKKRLWIYLGAIFFTILLPMDSLLADAVVALPLIALFELTLLLDRIFEGKEVVTRG